MALEKKVRFFSVLWFLLLSVSFAQAQDFDVTRTQYLMGTLLRVSANGHEATKAVDVFFQEIDRWEKLISTYQEDSVTSQLNQQGEKKLAPKDFSWVQLLQRSLFWAQETQGHYDPTLLPLMRLWGFRDGSPAVPNQQAIKSTLEIVGYTKVVLNAEEKKVKFRQKGMALDFGGIGKGYSLDQALKKSRQYQISALSANFGGQLLFWSSSQQSWNVHIRDPRYDGPISTREFKMSKNGSFSTSAMSENFRKKNDWFYGHIINPKTGWPVDHLESVTVWSPNAEEADVLSTALFVMGPNQGKIFAHDKNIAALFLLKTEGEHLDEVRSTSWEKIFGGN